MLAGTTASTKSACVEWNAYDIPEIKEGGVKKEEKIGSEKKEESVRGWKAV